MIVSLIAAVADNGIIGRANGLPWHLPADLRHFQRLTRGHTIIMGRRTYESVGRPLPDRRNIVVTRRTDLGTGLERVATLAEALALAAADGEVFVVGGSGLYREALPRADRLYLTRVHAEVPGDVSFPEWNRSEWILVSSERHEADPRHAYAYSFEQYHRTAS